MNMHSAKDKGIGLDRRQNPSESYFFFNVWKVRKRSLNWMQPAMKSQENDRQRKVRAAVLAKAYATFENFKGLQ